MAGEPHIHRPQAAPLRTLPDTAIGELGLHLSQIVRRVTQFVGRSEVQAIDPSAARDLLELLRGLEAQTNKLTDRPERLGDSAGSMARADGAIDPQAMSSLLMHRLNRSLRDLLTGPARREDPQSVGALLRGAAGEVAAKEARTEAATFVGTTFSLAEILQFLAFNEKDGEVELEATNGDIIWLTIKGGMVIGAASKRARPGMRIGEVLVSQGVLHKDDLAKVVLDPRARGRPMGQVLLERGLISREQLAAALEHQAGIFFRECGRLPQKAIRYTPKQGEARDVEFQLDLTWLLLEFARERDEAGRKP